MNFTEKFNVLLSLTKATPSALARAMYVDRTQISRLKTGARGKPTKSTTLREMAEYFASNSDSEYQLAALYNLTGDIRFQTFAPENVRADIIYHWLELEEEAVDTIKKAKSLEAFNGVPDVQPVPEYKDTEEVQAPRYITYYGNIGKRQAILDFMDCLIELKKTCTVLILTDESIQWGDGDFIKKFSKKIEIVVKKGFRFQFILSPFRDLDYAISFFKRWKTAYMQDALRFYYYPRLRDDLYRRMLMIVPDEFAVYADSLNGQMESRITIMTSELLAVNGFKEDYRDILSRCRPMIRVLKLHDLDEFFEYLSSMERLQEDCIFLSTSLSEITLPDIILKRISESGIPEAKHLCDNHHHRISIWKENCKKYLYTEIICLASKIDIIAGRVEIPLSRYLCGEKLYYTSDEYCLHLENMIGYLKNNSNYRVILIDKRKLKNIDVYVKGQDEVFFFKETDLLTVHEITEKLTASVFYDYLRQKMDKRLRFYSRESTIKQLKMVLDELRKQDLCRKEYDLTPNYRNIDLIMKK